MGGGAGFWGNKSCNSSCCLNSSDAILGDEGWAEVNEVVCLQSSHKGIRCSSSNRLGRRSDSHKVGGHNRSSCNTPLLHVDTHLGSLVDKGKVALHSKRDLSLPFTESCLVVEDGSGINSSKGVVVKVVKLQ